ncbi:Uncharacterized protein dnl_50860 [Desulfonema limicola]|uniref:Uncharacterized protein n=1 Tax=Desulfonema limicola TaxID=45656 RepID=A0A975BCJ6_9BACT|nr:Uncharacterized protein dnl_21260 [Desulfonema limicola]QTA82704.1 Uncharacterized protein dnl_50860 [Desulfonema limicola]
MLFFYKKIHFKNYKDLKMIKSKLLFMVFGSVVCARKVIYGESFWRIYLKTL